jgi:mannose-6-phosphate isomerase-like protein (cupin superfamily)
VGSRIPPEFHPAAHPDTGPQVPTGSNYFILLGFALSNARYRSHDFDEYFTVVQGCYTLIIDGKRIPVKAGEEYFIPRGVLHGGEPAAGTRTIHAFGGHRANRVL